MSHTHTKNSVVNLVVFVVGVSVCGRQYRNGVDVLWLSILFDLDRDGFGLSILQTQSKMMMIYSKTSLNLPLIKDHLKG